MTPDEKEHIKKVVEQPSMKVIKCEGFASGKECGAEGQWLKSYDPEAYEGRGFAEWTSDKKEAMKFPEAMDALVCWRQVSVTRPVREDGKPNRPLTSFTVTVENYEE